MLPAFVQIVRGQAAPLKANAKAKRTLQYPQEPEVPPG